MLPVVVVEMSPVVVVTPPVAVSSPVTVCVPVTVSAPATVAPPDAVSNPATDAAPDTAMLPPKVAGPASVVDPVTCNDSPRNVFSFTASPPLVWIDAVASGAEASTVEVTCTAPPNVVAPAAFRVPADAIPPVPVVAMSPLPVVSTLPESVVTMLPVPVVRMSPVADVTPPAAVTSPSNVDVDTTDMVPPTVADEVVEKAPDTWPGPSTTMDPIVATPAAPKSPSTNKSLPT